MIKQGGTIMDQFNPFQLKGPGAFRKNLTTAYVFIIISAIFFLLFFFNTQEWPVIACAFLCDAAAIVYLFRAINAYKKENTNSPVDEQKPKEQAQDE